MKDFANLSKHQQKRRVQALGSRAEKVLWFVSNFGLELDTILFCDKGGKKYPVKLGNQPSVQTKPGSNMPLQQQMPYAIYI